MVADQYEELVVDVMRQGPLRAGLIGLGAMGRNHARVLQQMDGVDLVVVADPAGDPGHVVRDASLVGTVEEAIDRGLDICVVAAPTKYHLDLAVKLAAAGVSTLIEKPLASSKEDAEAIRAAFDASDALGCVGHIERFNPAVQGMRKKLAEGLLGEIYHVSTSRIGPFPARIADVGVILDLATHDFDTTAWITGMEFSSVSARTAHRSGREHEDLVSIVANLDGGLISTHSISWLSPYKERRTVVTGANGALVADTLTADLTFYENGVPNVRWDALSQFRGVAQGDITTYSIQKPEPLLAELQAFVDAVRGGDAPIVTLEAAVGTVAVASATLESSLTGMPAHV